MQNGGDLPRASSRTGFQEVQLANPPGYRSPLPNASPSGVGLMIRNSPQQQQPPNYPSARANDDNRGGQNPTNSTNGFNSGNSQRLGGPSQYVDAGVGPSSSSSTSSPSSGVGTDNAERHAMVGRMQREKTMIAAKSKFDVPTYPDEVEMVFEVFYHQDGTQYSCLYKNKHRYIVDPRSPKPLPFPKQWFNEGIIVTDKVVTPQASGPPPPPSQPDNVPASFPPTNPTAGAAADDRAGYINHPTKGRLQTYISQEKRNVHRYYEQESGEWIPLPISWELRSPTIKSLLENIQEALPDWDDQQDMLASLRASNYLVEECIGHYFTTGGALAIPSARNKQDAGVLADKEKLIMLLEDKVKSVETQLKTLTMSLEQETAAKKRAEANEASSVERAAMLEAELAQVNASIAAMLRDKDAQIAQRDEELAQAFAAASSATAAPVIQREKTAVVIHKTEISHVDRAAVMEAAANTKLLHKEQVGLRVQVKNAFADLQQMFLNVTKGVDAMSRVDSGALAELNEMKELYRREALQRKLLYNQFLSDTEVLPPGAKKPYTFDKIFTPQATQEDVYEDTKPIITSCVDGYNVCILAYGQTGSGKTHTMQGPSEDPGVNTRSIRDLLDICQTRENLEYTLTASMVEIYNETIHDLLNNQINQLEIRAQGNKIVLPGMVEMDVKSVEDIENIMKLGNKNRTTAATKMNSQSSRSHLIFMITVKGRDKITGTISTGTLTLCDLAGSERVGKSEATGQRLVEAAAINKSLSSLGQVFTALKTGQMHIPYRNSKLTHILQPALGGDAKACLFVMISPDSYNTSETVSTLQFGSNASQIALGQAKKNISKGQPDQ